MFKKIGTLLFVAAFLLMLVRPLSAAADTAPDIWVETYSGILDLTTMQYYYQNLSPGQKDICNYLVGMSNYMYLDARGFSFSDNTLGSQSTFIAKMISLGSKILFMDSGINGWGSRFNPFLQNYISACINYSYAQSTDITFSLWYESLDDNFVLPYSAELLDSWNVWYNDNSIEGIQSFGDVVSPWNSGSIYDFAYDGYSWNSQGELNSYNSFILNNSPVLFSQSLPLASGLYAQIICGSFSVLPDTLYIARVQGSNQVQSGRFGLYNNGNLGLISSTSYCQSLTIQFNQGNGRIYTSSSGRSYYRYSAFTYSILTDLGTFIDYAFGLTPLSAQTSATYDVNFRGAYPFISHVFLVDNLNTLSNPEEIYNVDDLDIDLGSNLINKPISKYWWVFKNIDDNFPYPENPIVDNLVDDNGDPVTDPPLTTSIVNNNTVNNYYITNGEPITVPVNWFSRAESYVSYLWSMTEPLVLYARDLLDCMTFFDDGILSNVKGPGPAIFGICVIGVAGGIVSKLLL